MNLETVAVRSEWQYGVGQDGDGTVVITTPEKEYDLTFATSALLGDFIVTCLSAYGDMLRWELDATAAPHLDALMDALRIGAQ